MKKLSCIISVVLLFCATSLKAQDADNTKMEKVMAVHDSVMNEMPKMSKLINRLQTMARASDDSEKYENAVLDLKSANKSMMDWMAGFGSRFEADEMMKGKKLSEQKQKWLLEEEEKLAGLRNDIESSISRAEALLK